MRKLSADEQALWNKVVETVEPLSRKKHRSGPVKPDAAPGIRPARGRIAPATMAVPAAPPPPRVPMGEGGLDGHWDRRLKAGIVSPDRVIDLHGRNLDSAWNAIDSGIGEAISSGSRLVLLITGHAPKGAPPVERGKIRAAVHDWLGASRHAGAIAAVRGAHPRHGGRGALYVILRRTRI